jgi:hypothetical protein
MPSFSFRQEFDDVYGATRAMLSRQGPARVSGAVLLAAPALVFATALLRGWAAPAALRFCLPVLAGCWGMYFLGRTLACWWVARSAQKRAEAAGLERTVTLDEEGVELRTPAGSARIPWAGLVRVRETPKAFLLYVDAARVLILPKRAMGAAGEVDQVRQTIATMMVKARGV